MENLDLCVLRFHYGLHPGHNLRKTAGSDNPAGRLPSFCNESHRAPDWCVFLALPSSGQVLTSWRPISLWFSLWREPEKPPAVKDPLREAACSKERRQGLCVSGGRAGKGRSPWFSCQLNCCLLLFKIMPQGYPQSPQSHRNALRFSAPTQAGYEGARNGPIQHTDVWFSTEQGKF